MRLLMDAPAAPSTDRRTGKVVRLLHDYGFISVEGIPQDIYFKPSWFRGSPPLREGETVSFELKVFGTDLTAYNLTRASGEGSTRGAPQGRGGSRLPVNDFLFDWAYLGYVPDVLRELAGLALQERWEFKNEPRSPERPLPILYSYLLHTFGRLVLERKVLVNEKASCAAFNTGLVDPLYEEIYAFFAAQDDPRAAWQLVGFCIAGESAVGQNLVRYLNPLPSSAHYFDEPTDLLYDTRVGKPELDWQHVIIERIDRYPQEFLEDNWPHGFPAKEASQLNVDERKAYHAELGRAIEQDNRTYRRIMNRMKDAVDLSIKRASWNFKTAVPHYYPRIRRLQLLLPICLVSDEHVDLALAVEKTPSANYLGHTVLTLDWAYKNARLVCRPDSDWLAPQEITEGIQQDDDS